MAASSWFPIGGLLFPAAVLAASTSSRRRAWV